jgi:hypothetical protein
VFFGGLAVFHLHCSVPGVKPVDDTVQPLGKATDFPEKPRNGPERHKQLGLLKNKEKKRKRQEIKGTGLKL